jgi:dCMP deaminase
VKEKFINAYMKVAETFAKLSSARRLHVGAIIVKDDRIISIGYNGMPSGWDNDCEDLVVYRKEIEPGLFNNEYTHEWKTKPEVLHAETNAIAKLAKSTESGNGATLFVTHAPCMDCAKLVYQSGISSVYYRNTYRSEDGINFLNAAGVNVNRV